MNNLEIVEAAYAKLAAGDAAGFLDVFRDDYRLHILRGFPSLAGPFDGKPAWLEGFVMPVMTATGGTFGPIVKWWQPVGEDLVAGHYDVRFSLDGEPLRGDAVIVHRLEAGQIVESWEVPSFDPAVETRFDAAVAAAKAG